MKNILFRTVLLVVLLMTGLNASAQDFNDPRFARYGATPEEREKNLIAYNAFNDAIKFNNMPRALSLLNQLLMTAPKAGENLYIRGAALYRKQIALTKDEATKNLYKDSLLRLYDIRLANFGDHPQRGTSYIVGEKGKEVIRLFNENPEELSKLIGQVIELAKENIDITMLQQYFKSLADGYMEDNVETELLLNEYDKIISTMDKLTFEGKADAKKVIEQLFLQSGAANCDNLVKLFKPQYEANPDDKELMAKILGYFARNSCENEFSALLAEKYHAIEPSAASAYALAGSYGAKKEYDKAYGFYNEAIELEPEDNNKSLFATRAAAVALLAGDPRRSAEFAKKAISVNDQNGSAYQLLGQAYAQGSTGCTGFAKQAVFWLVVDVLTKARNLSTGDDAVIETINKQIATYSSYFPASEDLLDDGIAQGSSFNVNCGWISGTTSARPRK